MFAIQRWFASLILIAALHMTEQLILGIDELYKIRRVLAHYYAWFTNADFATVLLVFIVVLFVLLLIYGVLVRGRPLLWVMGFFVVISITEAHHLIESIFERRYVPGAVTGVIWVGIGVMLGRAVLRQAKQPDDLPAR
jgi:hypothetical protein